MTDDTPLPAQPPDKPPRPRTLAEAMKGLVLAERYRVDGVLGEGGMALVFDGHHLGLDRPIAIKVLKPEFVAEPQIIARFEQEARAVSRLEHVGIVKMYDVGTAEVPGLLTPIAFLVMERLRGAELSDLLRDEGPAPAGVALGWTEEILSAIAHAHSRGVVHRDLKPENVFACEVPEGGRVLKLVDFGIAKMVQPSGDAPLTQMGMVFGTPAYMSPEQATGHPVDGRTDLYSAGVILFEMLSGDVPFSSGDMMEVLRKQVREPPPKLPVAEPVSEVLERLLAKSPEDRYPDAASAVAAIRGARERLSNQGPARIPTPPIPSIVESPTAAAIHDPLGVAEFASAPLAKPNTPTAAAIPQSVRNTSAALDVSAPPPQQAPPPWAALRDRVPRPAFVGIAVALAATVGLLIAKSLWTSSVPPDEIDVAVALPAAPSAADPEALAAIDAKLAIDARGKAQRLLEPLLEAFPDDPEVVWRAALAEGHEGRYSEARGMLMLRAVELDPSRMKDPDAQKVILRELERSVVSDALVELVVAHAAPMREDWTRALLGTRLAALPYEQRHRLLDAKGNAGPDPDAFDPIEHRCLDLWQAEATDRPCTIFGQTLDAMEASPSASYQRTVSGVDLPTAGSEEKDSVCADLEARTDAVLEALEDADGDEDFVPKEYRAKAKTSKKKSRGRFRLRGLFR